MAKNLFIETKSGKLQNLYLLQDVRAIESEEEPEKYALAYVQENGVILEDMLYDTMEEAEAAVEEVKAEILGE